MIKMSLYIENMPPKLSAGDLCDWSEPSGAMGRIEMTDD